MGKQIIARVGDGPDTTRWTTFAGYFRYVSFDFQGNCPWNAAGTFRNLKIKLSAAPGSGKSWTVVVWKGSGTAAASATSLTLTIADLATTGEDVTHSFTVAPGDYLRMLWTAAGSPATIPRVSYSVEFDGDNPGESCYAQHYGAIDQVVTRYTGAFWECYRSSSLDTWNDPSGLPGSIAFGNSDPVEFGNIVSVPGSITGIYLRTSDGTTPGTGASHEFCYWLAKAATPDTFVKQDGSGVTVDTRCVLSGSNQTATATFDLPVAVGDRVYVSDIPSVSPAPNLWHSVAIATRFTASTDGRYMVGGWKTGPSPNGTRYYTNGMSFGSGTEAYEAVLGNLTDMHLIDGLLVRMQQTPQSGEEWAITLMKNGSPTSIVATVTSAGFYAASPITTPVLIEDGDSFSIRMFSDDPFIDEARFTWAMGVSELDPNLAPVVDAGPDAAAITGVATALAGSGTDDGLPDPPDLLTFLWTVVSGPGTPVFADDTDPLSLVTFPVAGVYVLELTGSDSVLDDSDTVTYTVEDPNLPPVVDAGPDAPATTGVATTLAGSGTDDEVLTFLWTVVSGPGTPVFTDATDPLSSVTFPVAGVYVLELTGNDGELEAGDTVTYTVEDEPPEPVITTDDVTITVLDCADAGDDQTICADPGIVTLTATVTGEYDTAAWALVSGPGPAVIDDATSLITTALIPLAGTYVFEITITGVELLGTATDTITVTVEDCPVLIVETPQDVCLSPGIGSLDVTVVGGEFDTLLWTQIDGPPATILEPTTANTSVLMDTLGAHVFRVTVTQGDLVSTADITLVVAECPAPFTVTAGDPVQVICLDPGSVTLTGVVDEEES